MKTISKQFAAGIRHFFAALGFMRQHKLLWYFIFPFVISALMAWGAIALISTAVDSVSVISHDYLQVEPDVVEEGRWSFFWEWWETLKSWFNDSSGVIVAVILRILLWFLLAITTKYVLLILMSPVLAFLSEQAEQKVAGTNYPFDMGRIMKDILRGMLVALRNFFWEFSLVALIWMISLLLPIIAPFTIIATILISAYYYGFSMIDYVNERRRLGLGEGARYVRQHKGHALAIGLFIAVGMKVPVFGFILASFASILGAVAAVTTAHESVDLSANPYAVKASADRQTPAPRQTIDRTVDTPENPSSTL